MSERVKKAAKEIRQYEASKTRAIDEFFMELEKNPYAGLPEGYDPLSVDIKEAWLEMNRAKREVTVLVSQVEGIMDKIAALIFSMMENPLCDSEIVLATMEDLQTQVNLLEDKIRNNNFDVEFYEWWLHEVKRDDIFADECRRMREDE